MHIVFLILKILGFTILGLLALVLFLLLLILIVPFRYGGKIRVIENFEAEANLSWLLRIINVAVEFRDKNIKLLIKLFGIIKIPLSGNDKKAESENDDKAAADAPTDFDEDIEAHSGEPESTEANETSETTKSDKKSEKSKTKKKNKAADDREPIEKFEDFIIKAEDSLENLSDKFSFLNEDRCLKAINRAIWAVKKILKHLLPRKIDGYLIFGFDDPALTGKVTAWISALLPIHKNRLSITPVFTEKKLETEISFKGHIRIGTIVLIGIITILDRNILYLLKNIKKHFGKTGGK